MKPYVAAPLMAKQTDAYIVNCPQALRFGYINLNIIILLFAGYACHLSFYTGPLQLIIFTTQTQSTPAEF